MPELNKNHAARLRRVDQRLDRALDAIMQANGELWPAQLRPYGERMQEAVDILQKLSSDIREHVSGAVVTPEPVEAEVDANQEDIEDVAEVAQEQPSDASARRRGRAAA